MRWVGVVLRLSAVATITMNDHVCEMVRDHRPEGVGAYVPTDLGRVHALRDVSTSLFGT